jgi:hypothetical protein
MSSLLYKPSFHLSLKMVSLSLWSGSLLLLQQAGDQKRKTNNKRKGRSQASFPAQTAQGRRETKKRRKNCVMKGGNSKA